jgi:hypothetical protein
MLTIVICVYEFTRPCEYEFADQGHMIYSDKFEFQVTRVFLAIAVYMPLISNYDTLGS